MPKATRVNKDSGLTCPACSHNRIYLDSVQPGVHQCAACEAIFSNNIWLGRSYELGGAAVRPEPESRNGALFRLYLRLEQGNGPPARLVQPGDSVADPGGVGEGNRGGFALCLAARGGVREMLTFWETTQRGERICLLLDDGRTIQGPVLASGFTKKDWWEWHICDQGKRFRDGETSQITEYDGKLYLPAN